MHAAGEKAGIAEKEIVAYLQKQGEIAWTTHLLSGTEGAPEKLTALKNPVDIKRFQKEFGNPGRIEKDSFPFLPVQPVGLDPKGEIWRYGNVGLFVRDGTILQFAEWKKNTDAKPPDKEKNKDGKEQAPNSCIVGDLRLKKLPEKNKDGHDQYILEFTDVAGATWSLGAAVDQKQRAVLIETYKK